MIKQTFYTDDPRSLRPHGFEVRLWCEGFGAEYIKHLAEGGK